MASGYSRCKLGPASRLKYSGDFEAEVIISNFEQTGTDWVATVVCIGDTETEAWESRNKTLKKIQQEFQSHTFIDSVTRG